MKQIPLLLIMCPPFWEKLPSAGIAYIIEYLKNYHFNAIFYDLNILIYKKMPEQFKKDWTINKNYITLSFFEYCFKKYKSDFNKILEIIKENNINFVGFSVLKNNRVFCINTAKFIKRYFRKVKIIFGGPEVFSMYLKNFNNINEIDYFVVGEGEKSVLNLLENKAENITEFLQIEDLNFFPKYEEFNLSSYTRKNALPIVASRGCVNKCRFCVERLLFKYYRARDPRNVFEEIVYHYKHNNIQWFTFYDSIFNADLTKLEKLMDLIIKNNLNIVWDAQIAIRNDMDLELFKKMKKAGCINLFVGLESASDRMLQLMNKNFTVKDAIEFFKKLNKIDLQFEVSLIVNYPGETEDDFNETLNFIRYNRKLIKKIGQISGFKNYPGISVEIPENYNSKLDKLKIDRLLQVLDEYKIKYTKSFIDNLI